MMTGREIRFGVMLLVGFVLLFFVTCGRGGSKATATGPTAPPTAYAAPTPSLPPTPPPTSPLPLPPATSQVAKPGSGDQAYTISPATYAPSDPCATLGSDVSVASAPTACQQEWLALGVTDIPGADLMNTMGMPHNVLAGPGVSQADAIRVATGFYRWQAFQTWAENTTLVAAMQALDPPGHSDPVVDALNGQASARVTSVPQCNLPVALRVVRLDTGAVDFIRSQGWSVSNNLAVLATYPQCAGITVTFANNQTTTVAPSTAITAINPGEFTTTAPFGEVWKIEGEVGCGSSDKLAAVCSGGS